MKKQGEAARFLGNGFARLVLPACLWVGGGGCASLPLARSPDLQVQCRRDMAHASQLRGLPLNPDVAIERETPDVLMTSLTAELDKPENQAYLAETGCLLKQLRVIRKDQDLKALFLKVMGQQVAAYYDPAKKRVAYVEGASKAFTNSPALPMIDRFVYVHEFCHAVEDGQFGIEKLTLASMSDFDRNMALTSVVEGDAMLVGLDSVFAEAPFNTATPLGAAAVGLMGQMDVSDEVKAMGDCPAFLSGALLRPYLDGAVFSNRLRREGGWAAVDGVYRGRLPRTTAEILYPERRYLRGFEPAVFRTDPGLLSSTAGIMTNRVGAMGIALWLGGQKLVQPKEYSFLKGWQGDEIYLVKDASGETGRSVWLSYWERAGLAKAFSRQAEKRLSATYSDAVWSVRRNGRLVAITWADKGSSGSCEELCARAVGTPVEAGRLPGGLSSWCSDLPLPGRFHGYPDHSVDAELLGGHVLDVGRGSDFYRFNLADGLVLRAEANPDRFYWGTLGGLVRYVSDDRSGFTFWRVPGVFSWFSREVVDHEQYSWRLLFGLAAYGNERKASVLFVPVWRHEDR